jgi:MYXO-CTERM domain-containing protein
LSFQPTTGLNNGTEQVFLYQGHIGTDVDGGNVDAAVQGPTTQLLWGMQVSPAGAWVPRNDALNLSDLPTSLNGHALVLPSSGDAGSFGAYYYDTTKGPIHGTKAVLQAAFENPANWTSGAGPVLCSTVVSATFTVDPDVVDSGSDAATGTGGTDGGATGTGGMTGTDSGADTGSGNGGTTGTDAAPDTGTGAGGTGTGGSGAGGSTDSGATDVKADTGTATDAKADTGTATDAKADTGSTGTDAKVDTGGTKVDAGKDGGTTTSSSGCSCSTASNGANISTGAWALALAGVLMTARRRRRR